uniref:Uncharacterized protein n=1 Tax=Arundo donax TaxID=35708 RepID=A0A0A9BFL6_ARUDO
MTVKDRSLARERTRHLSQAI